MRRVCLLTVLILQLRKIDSVAIASICIKQRCSDKLQARIGTYEQYQDRAPLDLYTY